MNRFREMFVSLESRNFRLFFAGQAVSQTGEWAQRIGQAWLVLELSDSGVLLGATAALQALPVLVIGPWGGLLADRIDKRRLMVCTQALAGVLALLLGALTATGVVEIWMVLVLAVALGVLKALDHPARKNIVFEMVDQEHVVNAVTLDNVLFNVAKVFGPAVAGVLIAAVGLAASFYLNAASYLAVIAALLLMRTSELQSAPRVARAPGQVRAGFSYVAATPRLLGPLLLMTVCGILAFEWAVTLPLLARDAFGGDAQTFGAMFSAMGFGAIIGGLAAASVLKPTTRSLLITALGFSGFMMLTALAPTLPLVMFALVLLGGANTAFRAGATALMQLRSVPQMRGRVMALLSVALMGTQPVGGPLLGWLAELFGIRAVIALGAAASAVSAIGSFVYVRRSGAASVVMPTRERAEVSEALKAAAREP